MAITLTTNAEMLAARAEELNAFNGIKLLNIKQNLALLLELIGREQLFSEYTKHDVSHIEHMLEMLDWLIPVDTKNIMTSADWLMTVLSIYFHDLGMLVTKREYESRHSSGFSSFRDSVLFTGDKGADYKAKVKEMGEDAGERFLYQEFVRHTHAERIRSWIIGQGRERLGISDDVIAEIDRLLVPFDETFREDLALICESHHLEDLDNFKKYKVRRPYGGSEAETANLQYTAILMRTADLLHITKDRTPSTSYRLINPTDPISQEEWAKQMAVTTVRSQFGRDKDGNFDEQAPRDTIEVYARFSQQEGFFALTYYLIYAEEQIRKSYEWARTANKTQGVRHRFPWRKIDDSNIETKGFLRDTFGFSIDQPKILKLLTGHTLYNDTSVVLRELVQNALDAVRLQKHIDEEANLPAIAGKIEIVWSSKDRILSITDNGTGMSQDIIERNLLTVGASRYEDPDFKKRYPTFSPISRFGIGILSTFMIADSVEIITSSPDEDQARQLSLRSVLGRYLIRLLDKEKDEHVKRLAPHGTLIKLKVRYSAETPDFLGAAKRWIVLPDCEVTIKIDESSPVKVGYSSPTEALKSALADLSILVDPPAGAANNKQIVIHEKELDGVTVAYALEWSEAFQEWAFLAPTYYADEIKREDLNRLGTCIEGIRVEFTSPGYTGVNLFAIANTKGLNAPKTNVARSGLENTHERDEMLKSIYSIYCNHVKSEMEALYRQRSYSLTWAIQELRYILKPLIFSSQERKDSVPLNRNMLLAQIKELPMFLTERNGQRDAISISTLTNETAFWTIDSPLFRFAENVIREIPGNTSLAVLSRIYTDIQVNVPDELLLCETTIRSNIDNEAFAGKEVDTINLYREQRRVDFRWSKISDPCRWRTLTLESQSDITMANRMGFALSPHVDGVFVAQRDITISGMKDDSIIVASNGIYILRNSPLAKYINKWFEKIDRDEDVRSQTILITIFSAVQYLTRRGVGLYMGINPNEPVSSLLKAMGMPDIIDDPIEYAELTQAFSTMKIYQPSAWSRDRSE